MGRDSRPYLRARLFCKKSGNIRKYRVSSDNMTNDSNSIANKKNW